MTSQARSGLYGVGQVAAINKANVHNMPAWTKWLGNMKKENANWVISFHSPVEFYVDNNQVVPSALREPPEPPQGDDSATSSMEQAINDNEVPVPSNNQPRTPTGGQGSIRRPSTSGTPQTPPGFRQSSASPNTPHSTGIRQSSASPNTPGSLAQARRPTITGQPASNLPLRPQHHRQSSTLNPGHGRSTSISSIQGAQGFPSGFDISDNILQSVRTIDGKDGPGILEYVKNIVDKHKSGGITGDNWGLMVKMIQAFFDMIVTGDSRHFNGGTQSAKESGYPDDVVSDCIVIAYGDFRLRKLGQRTYVVT